MKKFAFSLAALLALSVAGVASASDFKAESSYQRATIHAGGVTADYTGLGVELYADHASGLNYSGKLASGDLDGIAVRGFDSEVGYRFGGIAGPVLGYQHASIGGFTDERVLAGASAKYQVTPEIGLTGKVLSDVDHFGKDVDVKVGGNYLIGGATIISADFGHNKMGGAKTQSSEIGVAHNLTSSMYLQGKAHYSDTDGSYSKGVSVGVGFNF